MISVYSFWKVYISCARRVYVLEDIPTPPAENPPLRCEGPADTLHMLHGLKAERPLDTHTDYGRREDQTILVFVA